MRLETQIQTQQHHAPFCLRTEPNRNKSDLQGQFKENELPQRIFAQVQSEPTFRTFVNWYTHTNSLHPQQKTVDLHVNCVIDGSRVRDRKHESCEQLARHNIGITQNPWTPTQKDNCGEFNFSHFASLQMCLGVQANSSTNYFFNVCAITSFAELVTCVCCAFDNGQAQSSATTECKGSNVLPGTSDTNLNQGEMPLEP